MLMQPQAPVLFLGAEMWEGDCFLHQLILSLLSGNGSLTSSRGLKHQSSNRIAKRCWVKKQHSNAVVTISVKNKHTQRMLLWSSAKQVMVLWQDAAFVPQVKGWRRRLQGWETDPEKVRRKAKLRIVRFITLSPENPFSLSSPSVQQPEAAKWWGFSCCSG